MTSSTPARTDGSAGADPAAGSLAEVVERLRAAGIAGAEQEARQLIEWVAADSGSAVDDGRLLDQLVAERCTGVPLQRVFGRVPFRRVELLIGPGVFRPQPETGVLVQAAVDHLAWLLAEGRAHPRCVDLCTGCGTVAVAVAAEVPAAEMHAVELDEVAVSWARRNARHNDVDVQVHHGDVAAALPGEDGTYDLVMSNPPYVGVGEMHRVDPEVRDYDPRIALEAGADGLDLIRLVERTGARLLRPGGLLVVEHSDRQGESAPAVFRDAGVWDRVADHRDQDGLDRFVTAIRL